MKLHRYTERFWAPRQIERAKFKGAAMARALRRGEPEYRPHPMYGVRRRLTAINLPKRTDALPG